MLAAESLRRLSRGEEGTSCTQVHYIKSVQITYNGAMAKRVEVHTDGHYLNGFDISSERRESRR
jgi:hypothetical protein